MKLSEKFKSMDEVRAEVMSMKSVLSEEDFELFLYVFGLLQNQGISELVTLNGEEVEIDKSMVSMIVSLNERGFKTLACCSGLAEEHPQKRFKPQSGYLCITYDPQLLDYLTSSLTSPIYEIYESECYLNRCVSIHIKCNEDDLLKEYWDEVYSMLLKYKKINE